MGRIPRHYSHFVFGIIQSGITSAVAAAVASVDYFAAGAFLLHWLVSWLIAWALMLPVVIAGAPVIRRVTLLLTQDDQPAK